MIGFVLILALSAVGAHSQRRAVATMQSPCPLNAAPLNQVFIQAESYYIPPISPSCERVVTYAPTSVPNIVPAAMPVAVAPVISAPVIPFVDDLPSCPDVYFNEILVSPVGCLDPILGTYGAVAISEMPMSPLLPAASPVSALAPPFSPLLPPATVCDSDSLFLKRVPIPPPFI